MCHFEPLVVGADRIVENLKVLVSNPNARPILSWEHECACNATGLAAARILRQRRRPPAPGPVPVVRPLILGGGGEADFAYFSLAHFGTTDRQVAK
jgi:hypothetical protein